MKYIGMVKDNWMAG